MSTYRTVYFLFLLLILAGCKGVENMAGLELATADIAPTATPLPTATPDPHAIDLPNQAEKDFMGTTISFRYPEGWTTTERGQSLTAFDPDPAYQDRQPPAIGTFIALTSTLGIDDNLEVLAPVVMHHYLQRGAEFGFINPDAVPAPDQAIAFQWSEHDAAIYPWRSADESLVGVNLLVMNNNLRRFVTLGTQAEAATWEAIEPTWWAMVATFTLDGTSFAVDEVMAAYNSFFNQ